jgi:transaldolase
MKIFLDTADYEAVASRMQTGSIDGITTNPTSLSSVHDPRARIQELCALLPDGDISVEITERAPDAAYAQARRIAQIAENVIVKIPCLPEYISVIDRLVDEEIAVNVTLIFTPLQALCMARCGVVYVSPFVARLTESGGDGQQLLESIRDIFDTYEYETELLAASIRSVEQATNAALAGVDAITVAPAVFDQLFEHPLSRAGSEKFFADWGQRSSNNFP